MPAVSESSNVQPNNLRRLQVGVAFPRWRELCDKLGLQKDADLLCVPLDREG